MPGGVGRGADIAYRVTAGQVSEYEIREAAAAAHIPWPTFNEMEWEERVRVVAWYRMRNLIERHQHAAAMAGGAAGRGVEF